VRAPQWLGDAVVSTVFLHRLKSKYPSSQIHVLCPPAHSVIFNTHPAVEAVVTLPYPEGSVMEAARELRSAGYEIAYILPRSFQSALEAALARIPKRIGYRGDMRRFLLTTALPYDDRMKYAHRYLHLIGEGDYPLESLRSHFPQSEPLPQRKYELLGQDEKKLARPWLGISPASIAPARTWDEDRFAQVGGEFVKRTGGTVLLFGAEKEKIVTERILKKLNGKGIDTAGRLDLPELGWFIKSCDAFVCNDSGLMHVADSFSIPNVVIFGASEPLYALSTWGRSVALQNKGIACVPCLRNRCVRFGRYYNECLQSIEPPDVLDALWRLMKT